MDRIELPPYVILWHFQILHYCRDQTGIGTICRGQTEIGPNVEIRRRYDQLERSDGGYSDWFTLGRSSVHQG